MNNNKSLSERLKNLNEYSREDLEEVFSKLAKIPAKDICYVNSGDSYCEEIIEIVLDDAGIDTKYIPEITVEEYIKLLFNSYLVNTKDEDYEGYKKGRSKSYSDFMLACLIRNLYYARSKSKELMEFENIKLKDISRYAMDIYDNCEERKKEILDFFDKVWKNRYGDRVSAKNSCFLITENDIIRRIRDNMRFGTTLWDHIKILYNGVTASWFPDYLMKDFIKGKIGWFKKIRNEIFVPMLLCLTNGISMEEIYKKYGYN